MENETAIGIQHNIQGHEIFVAFWDYDPNEDFYYSWFSQETIGM